MTEDEAKTKWCHMSGGNSRVPTYTSPAMYRDIYSETRCLASACMAWRWERWERFDEASGTFVDAYPFERGAQAASGFCGLAGKLTNGK